jgi:hypothetical protein
MADEISHREGGATPQDTLRPTLTVKRYDAAEALALAGLSIPHLMAFRPVAFESVGWPTKVRNVRVSVAPDYPPEWRMWPIPYPRDGLSVTLSPV